MSTDIEIENFATLCGEQVRYNATLLGAIFKNSWNIATAKDSFLYKNRHATHQIDYFDIHSIRNDAGIVWHTVTIATQKMTINLKWLSAKIAASLIAALESRAKNAVISSILDNKELLLELEKQKNKFLATDRYISHTDIRRSISKINDVGEDLAHPFFDPDLLPEQVQCNLKLFRKITEPDSSYLKDINENFVEKSIQQFSYLFEKLEEFPLNEEQMRAAIINEDRNLLIAAAGSGKTSTIVAKAIYLVCAGLARPEEILILVYNKDAQIELDNRFGMLLGVAPKYNVPLKVKTFHSYGYEILSEIENNKPKISEFARGGKKGQSRLFTKLIKHLYDNDTSFMAAWREFLLMGKYPTPDLFKVKSKREYDYLLQKLGAIRRNLPEGRQFLIPTIDGKEVKSFEEARIANWLALNGVEYKYERRYINPSNPNEKFNYNPDFYYPQADLYHEHFAINSEGKTPPFMRDDYLNQSAWKRNVHERNNTKLIETHSAHFVDGTIFERLEQKLRENNVYLNPLEKSVADKLVSTAFEPEIDILLFITFIHHFKANNASFDYIKEQAHTVIDQRRASLFLSIFETIYTEYSKCLRESNEIDFEDQINLACDLLETNIYEHQFKYILVDEFQDTSQDRKRMIQALLNQNENIKLFAVGDDWQSIYRFTGVDIEIMTHFSNHFGATAQNYLTQTYRSFQGIVDVAATFIQRNEDQLKKNVKAIKHVDKDQVIMLGYQDNVDQMNQLKDLLNKLNAIQNKEKLSVFLLARYSHLRPNHIWRYPHLDIKFSTIHASKGLQADYVILLNVESGSYGFPSMVTDDPLMNLVIPKPETYPYAEERRLMYVAITRAKRGVFIFSNQNKISLFVTELAGINGVNASSMFPLKHQYASIGNGRNFH